MTANAQPKLPPLRVARAVDALRRTLRRFERKLQPPSASVLELISTAWVAQGVYTAANLGIADALRDGPLSAEAIAERVGANADGVHRLLRMLVSRGIFTRKADDRYALNGLADALRSDTPDSARGLVLLWGDPLHWEHWGQLSHAVRTGSPSVDHLRGKPVFEWLPEVPDFAARFNDGMTSVSDMEGPPVVAAYDFSSFGTIVDVGGGHGRLLGTILKKWPQTRGILFDAESVVEHAPPVLDATGVSDRCRVVGGSFFESVPSGGDAYVLKHIIHDWDNDNAVRILRNVRAAMSSSAKVLLIESVIPDDNHEHLSKLLDLEMLVVTTGKERTEAEYVDLLRQAGFRHTRTVPTVGPGSIVEAIAT